MVTIRDEFMEKETIKLFCVCDGESLTFWHDREYPDRWSIYAEASCKPSFWRRVKDAWKALRGKEYTYISLECGTEQIKKLIEVLQEEIPRAEEEMIKLTKENMLRARKKLKLEIYKKLQETFIESVPAVAVGDWLRKEIAKEEQQ